MPESDGAAIRVTPPSWRYDLAIEEDYVEEIARVHGYEHVPAKPPRARAPMLALPEGERDRHALRHLLAAAGYQEVVNYSFVAEEWERDFAGNSAPVRLANPIASHMSVMRTSLLAGLVQALRREPEPRRGARAPLRDRALLRGRPRRGGRAARAHRGPRLRRAAARAMGREGARRSISST